MSVERFPTPRERVRSVVLASLSRGVRICIIDGRIRYKLPAGVADAPELRELQSIESEAMTFLARLSELEHSWAGSLRNANVDLSPTSFSQLDYWNIHQLHVGVSRRVVGFAIRMKGVLIMDALKESIEGAVARHEALRTGIMNLDGTPVQRIQGAMRHNIERLDLKGVTEKERERELTGLIEDCLMEPVNVTRDTLLAIWLIQLCKDVNVLLVGMEHMISDGISSNILRRDILTMYEGFVLGRACSLPEVVVQFGDFAAWQRNAYHSWAGRCGGRSTQRIFVPYPQSDFIGIDRVPIRIEPKLRTELVEWCRLSRTTLVMAAFTAFVALVIRWFDVSEAVIQYQTHGRFSPSVKSSVGYFAFRQYLRIERVSDERFPELMRRVVSEYVRVLEQGERLYVDPYDQKGLCSAWPCFNWLTEDEDGASLSWELPGAGIECARVQYEGSIRRVEGITADSELMLGLLDVGTEVTGAIQFPTGRATVHDMERFGKNYLSYIRVLISGSVTSLEDIPLL